MDLKDLPEDVGICEAVKDTEDCAHGLQGEGFKLNFEGDDYNGAAAFENNSQDDQISLLENSNDCSEDDSSIFLKEGKEDGNASRILGLKDISKTIDAKYLSEFDDESVDDSINSIGPWNRSRTSSDSSKSAHSHKFLDVEANDDSDMELTVANNDKIDLKDFDLENIFGRRSRIPSPDLDAKAGEELQATSTFVRAELDICFLFTPKRRERPQPFSSLPTNHSDRVKQSVSADRTALPMEIPNSSLSMNGFDSIRDKFLTVESYEANFKKDSGSTKSPQKLSSDSKYDLSDTAKQGVIDEFNSYQPDAQDMPLAMKQIAKKNLSTSASLIGRNLKDSVAFAPCDSQSSGILSGPLISVENEENSLREENSPVDFDHSVYRRLHEEKLKLQHAQHRIRHASELSSRSLAFAVQELRALEQARIQAESKASKLENEVKCAQNNIAELLETTRTKQTEFNQSQCGSPSQIKSETKREDKLLKIDEDSAYLECSTIAMDSLSSPLTETVSKNQTITSFNKANQSQWSFSDMFPQESDMEKAKPKKERDSYEQPLTKAKEIFPQETVSETAQGKKEKDISILSRSSPIALAENSVTCRGDPLMPYATDVSDRKIALGFSVLERKLMMINIELEKCNTDYNRITNRGIKTKAALEDKQRLELRLADLSKEASNVRIALRAAPK